MDDRPTPMVTPQSGRLFPLPPPPKKGSGFIRSIKRSLDFLLPVFFLLLNWPYPSISHEAEEEAEEEEEEEEEEGKEEEETHTRPISRGKKTSRD